VKHYDYKGIPVPVVRRLARHTLLGLQYIHSRGVIHTDVKLENVLIQRHDLPDLIRESHRAHRAFMEQRSGAAVLTKNQKKRMKKKQKNAQAKGETKEESDGEGAVESAVAAKTAPEAPAVAGGDEDVDRVAAAACGTPVPPVRQKDRFKTLKPEQVFAKLADFGNACRKDRPVTDDIQTRQYRSPEVIVGCEWDETADVWSAACMFFELLTGDFLFDPRTGKDWSRDEDHLALMIELLGDLPPKDWILSGKYARDFFSNAGKLKHIKSLKFWSLCSVLTEKYEFEEEEAEQITGFLLPMLAWEPSNRQSAAGALRHPWVQLMPGEVDVPPEPEKCEGGEATAAAPPSAEAARDAAEEKGNASPARDSASDDPTCSTAPQTDSCAGGENESVGELPASAPPASEPAAEKKEQEPTPEPKVEADDTEAKKEAVAEAAAGSEEVQKPPAPDEVAPDTTETRADTKVADEAKEVSKAESLQKPSDEADKVKADDKAAGLPNGQSREKPREEISESVAEAVENEAAAHDDKENCVEEEAEPAAAGGKAKKKKNKKKGKK